MPREVKPPKSYSPAESVQVIAQRLLPTYHSELATAEFIFLFVSEASKKNGRPVLGKVRRLSGAMAYLLEEKESIFLIEVALDMWNEMSEEARLALVDHLLERCQGEEDENTGAMKWSLREPDVQEFTTILSRHGAWNDDLTGMVSVAQQIDMDERVQEVEQTETEQTEQA